MKILSNKEYHELHMRIATLMKINNDMETINQDLMNQNINFKKINEELGNDLQEIEVLKKEIKRLKTLCTKNKIEWRQNEKKN